MDKLGYGVATVHDGMRSAAPPFIPSVSLRILRGVRCGGVGGTMTTSKPEATAPSVLCCRGTPQPTRDDAPGPRSRTVPGGSSSHRPLGESRSREGWRLHPLRRPRGPEARPFATVSSAPRWRGAARKRPKFAREAATSGLLSKLPLRAPRKVLPPGKATYGLTSADSRCLRSRRARSTRRRFPAVSPR